MNAQSANKKGFRVALVSFMVAGLLAIMLLASLGTSWGVAYGQSAGPTNTVPTDLCATTPPGGGQNGNGQNNAQCKTTPPSAVDNSGRQPTTAPSAVNNVNQGPVGVVPGLPNTGTGTQTTDDNSWKLIALALLLANMLIAGLIMRRYKKSSR